MKTKNCLDYHREIKTSKKVFHVKLSLALSVVAVIGFFSQTMILSAVNGKPISQHSFSAYTINATIMTLSFIGLICGIAAVIYAFIALKRRQTKANIALLISFVYWLLAATRIFKIVFL